MAIRVLLVDDVPELRFLFRRIFEMDERFEVVGEAGDGYQAIELARIHRPDVVVLDVAMPRLDGLQAIPLLHEASPASRIMMLSGFAGDSLAQTALDLTATAFIEKGAPTENIVELAEAVSKSPPKRTDR